MDRIASMQLFVRIVERGSFSLAASDHAIPRSTATHAIQILEERLGVKLLQRTTRHVAPTPEGENYHRHCKTILAQIEAAEESLIGAEPHGHLRVDIHGNLFRQLLLPHFSAFRERFPDLAIHVGDGDRLVDLIREGVDCVVRAGEPDNSGLMIRRLGLVDEVTVASAGYVERHGEPESLRDLEGGGHHMIGFVSSRTGTIMPLEFIDGADVRQVTLPAPVTVTNSDTSAALALAGFGLAQAPRYRFAKDIEAGRLVEILPAHPPTPTPISALYPHNRQVSPRVRVFVDWLVDIFTRRDW